MMNYLTDGGLETDLIHRQGIDLPHFAAFPLLDRIAGRAALRRYFDGYVSIAAAHGYGLMLESPTWRANPDWGALLGYDAPGLARVNADSIAFLAGIRDDIIDRVPQVRIVGTVGPRHDGYSAEAHVAADVAADYHRPQLLAFASAGADLATAYTLTHADEAIGIVRAARELTLPIAISFTVETDGRLPDGTTLADTIARVDDAAAPDYYLVNCAHPSHIERALIGNGPWRQRIRGTRANASTRSHTELDASDDLDDGDPTAFAAAQRRLDGRLPHLEIRGGCCGTDARHVAALADAASTATPAYQE